MNLKCIKSKLISLISYLIIICLVLFFAACSDSSTGEDNSNDNNTVRTPSGHLYFMTSNPASIVKYDIRSDQFNILADENDQPINFSVAYNGSALAYISDNKKIVVLDLFNLQKKEFEPEFSPLDDITINFEGKLVAYRASLNSGSTIALLYVDAGSITKIDVEKAQSCRKPLFSKNDFKVVWTQNDGLYYKNLIGSQITKLFEQSLTAIDFSPNGKYLSTHEKIIDITDTSPYPGILQGEIKFADNQTVIYKPLNNNKLKISNLTGSESKDLVGYISGDFCFCIAPGGDYFTYITSQDSTNHILIKDILLNRPDIEKTYSVTNSTKVKYVFWRGLPYQTSK